MSNSILEYYVDTKLVLKNELCQDHNVIDLNELCSTPAQRRTKVLSHEYLKTGHYITCSTIDIANVKFLKEKYLHKHKGIFLVTGGYEYEQIVFTEKFIAVHPMFEWLNDYPVFDDNTLSQVEYDLECEQWDEWEAEEFLKLLVEKFPREEKRLTRLYKATSLRGLYNTVAEQYNYYPEFSGIDCKFWIREIVEKITLKDIKGE